MTLSHTRSKEILLVKFGAIGDCVMALGGVNRFLSENSDVKLTWLVGQSIEPLIKSTKLPIETVAFDLERLYGKSGFFSRVLETLKVFFWGFGKKFDLVLIGYRSPFYRWILGPFLFSKQWRNFHSQKNLLPGKYHADEYYRNLCKDRRKAKEGGTDLSIIELKGSQKGGTDLSIKGKIDVILAPGAAKNVLRDDGLRRWPIQHYVDLCEKLIQRGSQVALMGGKEDRWVKKKFENLPVQDWIDKTNLVESIHLLKAGKILVAHDSGPMHLGFLAGIRTIALFGPTRASEKVPFSLSKKSVMQNNEIRCRPCYDGQNYAVCDKNICLSTISVDDVYAKTIEFLSGAK